MDNSKKDALEKKYQQDIEKKMAKKKKYNASDKLKDCLKQQQ